MVLFDVAVRVPLHVARTAVGDDADEPHAVFDELAGEQAAATVVVRRFRVDPIEVSRFLRLAREVQNLLGLDLHAEGHVVGIDPRVEFFIVGGERGLVQIANQLQRLSPLARIDMGGQVEIQHGPLAGAEHRRLIDRRKKAVRVHRLARFQRPLRIGHHDVGRKRTAFDSETIQHPRAHAWKPRHDPAREEFVLSRRVNDHVAMTRPQHSDVVNATSNVREEVRDFDAILAVLAERPPRAEQPGVVSVIEQLRAGWTETGDAELDRLFRRLPTLDATAQTEIRQAFTATQLSCFIPRWQRCAAKVTPAHRTVSSTHSNASST